MLETLPSRFINWHMVPKQRPDGTWKDTKVPYDPTTGYDIDPHIATNWKTLEVATECTRHYAGCFLGWVFNGDGYFFIDLDGCREGDGWNATALTVCSYFPGAAMEVSQSGTGLHIIGWCQPHLTANCRNRWKNGTTGMEFYTDKRFIAFGPYGWSGNPKVHDFTQSVLSVVPQRDPNDDQMLTEGPRPEYTGPADDEALIQKMLAAQGSFSSAFGQKARFRDLWEAIAGNLAQFYPSPSGDAYNRSDADAALMSHLAFWTGCDAARMDRLFRRSGLMREKYETRPDYRQSTIVNSIRKCAKVYDVPARNERTLPQEVTQQQNQASGQHTGGGILDATQQIEYFKGCVYINDSHRVMLPDGRMLRPEQFKSLKGGYKFVIDHDGPLSKNAFEVFTESRVVQFDKVISTMFRPSLPVGFIDKNESKVNVYFPFVPKTVKGDPTPFLDFLQRLLPVKKDRDILLAYIASMCQNVGKKFYWAPVLQGAEGNGKTMILKCVEHVIGERYTLYPAASDLANSFNSFLEAKLFIGVEEIHMDGRREVLDILKPLITNERIETQPKGVDKRMVDNFSNWIFCTNYKDAVLLSKSNRRYSIFFTAQQNAQDIIDDGMGGDYFPLLWKWLREQDGYAIVADYLLSYQIPAELDPAGAMHRAPETSSTKEALSESMGRAEQYILEAVAAEERGFKGGWISGSALTVLLKTHGVRLSPNRKKKILEELDYKEAFRSPRNIPEEEGNKSEIYIRKSKYDVNLTIDDYCRDQGYSQPINLPLPHMQMAAQ